MNRHSLFSIRDLNTELKIRLVRCYIFLVLLYETECRTLFKDDMSTIQVFEMWNVYNNLVRPSTIENEQRRSGYKHHKNNKVCAILCVERVTVFYT